MRRFVSQFAAVIFVTGMLAPFTAASLPAANARRELHSSSIQATEDRGGQELIIPAAQHPFATEFYLQSIDDSTLLPEAAPARPQHAFMKLHPVTAAASNLSKMVASWRHVLARLMPTL